MPPTELDAAEARRQLAGHLAAAGWLRSPEWRAAVEAVPRHEFVTRFYVEALNPGVTTWTPITPELVGHDAWLLMAYSDQTLITQFDGRPIDWSDPQPLSNAEPTSSSTLPALVVRMLEDLDVHDGTTVLELGTGTGYSTALLCHRLGAENVTSIETDPHVAAAAEDALARCGYRPHLVVGDGRDGRPDRAPYDRTVATMGVRHVPSAWIEQTRVGGQIVCTLRGWMRSLGLVRLTVAADREAEGRFLSGDPSFMIARQQDAPTNLGVIPELNEGETRDTEFGPDLLTMPGSGFVAQLAMPGARFFSMPTDDGAVSTYVLDATNEAFAVLTPEGDGWTARQGGRARLWDDVEKSLALWRAAGSPPASGFGVTVTAASQYVWLGDPDGPRWHLPR